MTRLLYLCDAETGGIAEYAVQQIPALAIAGAEVSVICRPGFPIDRLRRCAVKSVLPALPGGAKRLSKLCKRIHDSRQVASIVCAFARSGEVDAVLSACYSEYFSPFWASIYRRLVRGGATIGTIAHDPVRDFIVGPGWWHRWSIRQGYSFVRDVFVHDDTPPDFGGAKPPRIRIHKIPHGPYPLAPEMLGRDQTRSRYGFKPSDRVFLAFGQIRDGKNLDRFLRVMPQLPNDVKLLVAGTGGSASQRQPSHYQQLAKDLKIADRCAWELRYIGDTETGDLFSAADFLLMAYSANFRSASGVMNTAVSARKLILGSSGPGPFRTAMLDYGIGVFVQPDDDNAILAGAKALLLDGATNARWDAHERDHSWEVNARLVLEALTKN